MTLLFFFIPYLYLSHSFSLSIYMLVSSSLYSLIPSIPILSFIAYSCLLSLLSITHSSSLHHQNLFISSLSLFMETVEFKVDMVGIHEKRLRKCLSKLKGIEKVEVDGSSQKVVVTGYAHKNKILKALKRSGLKAEFWSAQNEILLNAYASGSWNNSLFSRFNNLSFF